MVITLIQTSKRKKTVVAPFGRPVVGQENRIVKLWRELGISGSDIERICVIDNRLQLDYRGRIQAGTVLKAQVSILRKCVTQQGVRQQIDVLQSLTCIRRTIFEVQLRLLNVGPNSPSIP